MSIEILLVEDESAHAELVQRAFASRSQFHLSVVNTIAEARRSITCQPPALMIADWLLPDGECLQFVKEDPHFSIPIILMTSHGNEQIAVDAMKAGVLDYIVKSDQTLADMPHIAERALREWDLIIQRKRAEEELLRRVSELEAVSKISTSLRSAETLETMLPQLLDETLKTLALEDGAIWLFQPAMGELAQAIARGIFTEACVKFARPGEGVLGTVFERGQPHHSAEFSADALISANLSAGFPVGMSGVFLPVKSTNQAVGVVAVAVRPPRQLKASELHLLTTLSEIAGNAIHRTRLHEQTERNLRRLAGLRAIDLAISSSVDFRPTLEIILHHALAELGADAATILKLNPYHQLEIVTAKGFNIRPNPQTYLDLTSGYAGKAILENRLVSVPDISLAAQAFPAPSFSTGDLFAAYHAIPLVAKGQTKGVFEVFHRRPFQPDADWREYFQALASQSAIAIDNGELFENLQRSNQELRLAYDATIEGWSYALDLRDRETEGHTRRVVDMTIQFARRVGVREDELVHVRRGALLHDIGKMGIPDYILHKPEPLTEQEWEIMRKHPIYAYEMLSSVSYLLPALDIPYCHHEYWNGKGYPRGLKGEQIPLKARIFALVDVWDALNSDRPYRSAWPKQKVREYIQELSGQQFDPTLVTEFFRLLYAFDRT